MGSFKLKLVAYFLLLSLLPLAAAFWGFTAVAGQNETRRVDSRIQAGMRSVLASYEERLNEAASQARLVAQTPAVQNQLRVGDIQALVHILHEVKNVSVMAANGELIGRPPDLAATRQVRIEYRNRVLGYVTVAVPFDARLVSALRLHSGLAGSDSLVIAREGRIV